MRRFLRQAIALARYDVTEARAGFEALQQLDRQLPHIIVLDLMMPGIDGFTVRTELESQPRARHIPIVVFTAMTGDLRSLNVRRLLKKPVSPEEVVLAINDCLA